MPTVDVEVTFLEMTSPGQLRRGAVTPPGIVLRHERGAAAVDLAERLYREIGGPFHWRDRLPWSRSAWAESLDPDRAELWTARAGDEIVGYFELERREASVELRYFGIRAAHRGRGIGAWLLGEAVDRAWASQPERVTVNTCTLDDPGALPNYLARGFQIVRVDHQRRELPA